MNPEEARRQAVEDVDHYALMILDELREEDTNWPAERIVEELCFRGCYAVDHGSEDEEWQEAYNEAFRKEAEVAAQDIIEELMADGIRTAQRELRPSAGPVRSHEEVEEGELLSPRALRRRRACGEPTGEPSQIDMDTDEAAARETLRAPRTITKRRRGAMDRMTRMAAMRRLGESELVDTSFDDPLNDVRNAIDDVLDLAAAGGVEVAMEEASPSRVKEFKELVNDMRDLSNRIAKFL